MRPATHKVRGVLQAPGSVGKFRHARIEPSEALRGVVQHFWSVHWDLRDATPVMPETLPHPNVQLLFDAFTGMCLLLETLLTGLYFSPHEDRRRNLRDEVCEADHIFAIRADMCVVCRTIHRVSCYKHTNRLS